METVLHMMAVDFVMLALAVYISVRAMMLNQNALMKRFCHFSYSLVALEVINIVTRLWNFRAIDFSDTLAYWALALYFVILTLTSFEWLVFFEVFRNEKYLENTKKVIILSLPLIAMVAICIVSFFTDCLFYIADDRSVQKGPLFILSYILPYSYGLMFLVGFVRLYFKKDKESKRTILIMLATVIPILFGAFIHFFVQGSYLITACVAGGLLAYNELIVDEMKRLDKLAALGVVNKELEKNYQKIESDYNIIKSLAHAYSVIYLIDIKENKYTEIANNLPGVRGLVAETGNAMEQLEIFARHICYAEYGDKLSEFVDLTTIDGRINEANYYISTEFEAKLTGWGEAMFIPVERDNNNKLTQVIFAIVDINNKKILEFEQSNMLTMALDEARKANNYKSIFLNNLSHDIRTPMNAIVGFTNLAKSNIDNRDVFSRYLTNIEKASDHLLSIINDIIDLSRIENGKIEVVEKDTDMAMFLDDIVTIIRPSIEKKGLVINTNLSELKNHYVSVDKLKLEQILLNVLNNAIAFTEKDGIISFNVYCENSEKPGMVDYEFVITDTGMGMDQEIANLMFEDFVFESDELTNIQTESGMGMTIIKSFVDILDGKIEVKSAVNEGTKVKINLSFALCNGIVKEEEIASYDFTGKKVLVVEDIEINQEIAKAILEEIGFEVDLASDGREAVEIVSALETNKYDVILMDIRMPRLNGYEATVEIRNIDGPQSRIPIVAMTANAFEEDKKKASEAGMNAHLAKPIDVNLLKVTLARVIGIDR